MILSFLIFSEISYAFNGDSLSYPANKDSVNDRYRFSPQSGKLTALDDLSDKKIGIFTGSVYDTYLAKKYPDARIFRFENLSYLTMSLQRNKLDAVVLDRNTAAWVLKNNPDLGLLSDQMLEISLSVGFSKKNTLLQKEFNEFLAEAKSNGVLARITERWIIPGMEKTVLPEHETTTDGKKLVAGVSIERLPYADRQNRKYVGLDIELIKSFATEKNYELQFITVPYIDLFSSVHSGKVDLIASGIAVSEERASQILFSDEYIRSGTSVITSAHRLAGHPGSTDVITTEPFLKRVISGIYHSLLQKEVYSLILKGLGNTLLISVLSAVLGIVIGLWICILLLSENKVFRWLAGTYITIVRGIPLLVLLLVCFYVIFASVNIDPVFVAVFTFGINSAAFVSVMLKTTLGSINKGQIEAGIASGFTKRQTYVFIMLPQLLQRVFPLYKSEFVAILKMTSIVGFIAVEDLTKASDIIRSRTLDAFVPLIMAALIYFLITMLFLSALGYIERRLKPERRRYKFRKFLGL